MPFQRQLTAWPVFKRNWVLAIFFVGGCSRVTGYFLSVSKPPAKKITKTQFLSENHGCRDLCSQVGGKSVFLFLLASNWAIPSIMNAGNRPPSKQQSAYVCLVAQLCPTLCNPKDYSLPGFSVHGILQARILEWVIMPFNRRFSWPREWTWVSCIIGRFSTVWGTREALLAVEMPDIFISRDRYLQIPFILITALKSWKLFIICWILLHCAVLSLATWLCHKNLSFLMFWWLKNFNISDSLFYALRSIILRRRP